MAKQKQNKGSEAPQPPRELHQPDSNEQSGSAGRNTDVDKIEQGKDTGQGRYGQSGFGGPTDRETIGQSNYRQSGTAGVKKRDAPSNPGSGRADREAEEYGKGDARLKRPPASSRNKSTR